jgi:hypothetical protein
MAINVQQSIYSELADFLVSQPSGVVKNDTGSVFIYTVT